MYQSVLQFWFEELEPAKWWKKDVELDGQIAKRFTDLHEQARQGELFSWRENAHSSLAEVIVLDQFSRNIYRDSAKAFENDGMALVLAQTAIDKGFDQQLSQAQRSFLYLPFMHSESLVIHEQAEALYIALGIPDNLDFERKHKLIIERFGRYPHRNAILGRVSSEEEERFLKQPGSSF